MAKKNKHIKHSSVGIMNNVEQYNKKYYTPTEIKYYEINEAITQHPLASQPVNMRSKLAYKEIMHALTPTTKYLLPGQIVVFGYHTPKYKEELEYYDATPMTLFCGITRTKDGNIREIGLNLHYFPPFTRMKILEQTYEAFKPYFQRYFNNAPRKPNLYISYERLQHIMSANDKIAFGVKMYIPVLRGKSFVVPTRLLATASYTEGHFSKATLSQIFRYWRRF